MATALLVLRGTLSIYGSLLLHGALTFKWLAH
jgi:hypothetical protein